MNHMSPRGAGTRKGYGKPKEMVSVAISRASSLASLAQNFSTRLDGVIDEKSKSIADILARNKLQQYYQYNNLYYHPYAVGSDVTKNPMKFKAPNTI